MDNEIPVPLKNEPGGDLYQRPHHALSFAPRKESGLVLTDLILGPKVLQPPPKTQQKYLVKSPDHGLDAPAAWQVPSALSPTFGETAALPAGGGRGGAGRQAALLCICNGGTTSATPPGPNRHRAGLRHGRSASPQQYQVNEPDQG